MTAHKTKSIKEKVIGNVEESVGQLTDDKQLEVKGKVRQGVGKGYELADDYSHKAENIKDTVAGTTKEKIGELTDDQVLKMKGKIQKENTDNRLVKKMFYGLGVISVLVFLYTQIRKDH